MNLAGLCGQQHLSWLHADVHTFDAAEPQITTRPVQHNRGAGIDHMCLEEHLIDYAVVVDDVKFADGQVQTPVREVLVDDIDGVVFKGRVEAGAFENFSQDADGVDEVGIGGVNGERGHEGGVIIILEAGRVGYVLYSISKRIKRCSWRPESGGYRYRVYEDPV